MVEKIRISNGSDNKEIRCLRKNPKLANKIARKKFKTLTKIVLKENIGTGKISEKELILKLKKNKSLCAIFQLWLKRKGLYKGKIDGSYGKNLSYAIRKLSLKKKNSLNHKSLMREYGLKNSELNKRKLTLSTIKKLCHIAEKVTGISYKTMLNMVKTENQWFKPRIINPSTKASGLTQITPSTWDSIEKKYNIKFNKKNPIDQVLAGAYNLKRIMSRKHCSEEEALVYHNVGINFWKIGKKIITYYKKNPKITKAALKLKGIKKLPKTAKKAYALAKKLKIVSNNLNKSKKIYFMAAKRVYNREIIV